MTEKAGKTEIKTIHDLHEESSEFLDILTNRGGLPFQEWRKEAVDWVNDQLTKAHGSKSNTLKLLPPIEMPEKDDKVASFQSLTGQAPTPHYNFRA